MGNGYVFGAKSCHCGGGVPCDEINCVSVEYEFEILLEPLAEGYTPGVDTYITVSGSATFYCDGEGAFVRTCKDGAATADPGDYYGVEWAPFFFEGGSGWLITYGFPSGCNCNSGVSLYLNSSGWDGGCGDNPVPPNASFPNWPHDGSYQEYARDVEIDGVCHVGKVLIRGTIAMVQRAAESEEDCGCP